MNARSSGSTDSRAGASKARAVLGALSLIVLGAVLGIALDRHLHSSDGRGPAAAAFHDITMSSLEERIDLTAEQRRQIDSIVGARHNTLRHAWQTLHSQLGAAVDTVHAEIEAVLTPEQRTAFREWLREGIVEQ
jgi:Spy/CpxP family protein refolding chaperone